ncbi:MAG: DNA repair protein RecN [Turicibacter sp.]
MLSHLSIKNMAIIESLQLDLNDGMTVLTGETGAGKSIIIDSISLLIGDRASSEMVRHEEEMAIIEGSFEVQGNKTLLQYLASQDISCEDQLIVKRTIKRVGGGQIRVNGELVTLTQLKEIGRHLVDIHVQHDTHRLFDSEHNYELVDHFNGEVVKSKNEDYQEALKTYQKTKRNYLDFKKNAIEIAKRIDLILFQRDEIEKHNLRLGELEELEERRQLILNADKLHKKYSLILYHLNGDGGVVEKLYESMSETQTIASIDESMSQVASQMGDVYYGLEEMLTVFSTKLNELNYSPEELDDIETRINELQQVKRKYRMEIPEIIDYYQQILLELAQVEDSESYEKTLYQQVVIAYNALLNKGELLNDARKMIANQIEKELVLELNDLQLFNTQFEVEFTRLNVNDEINASFNGNGLYDIQFLLSTNKGEPMKPLHKTASGGELSRIMLALKTILNRGHFISTIIFDEIDTGVSGQVASSIGAKMKEISKNKQVLCITHLPQVASLAKHHIHVIKMEKEGRTVTSIQNLSIKQRTNEIARMLSGDNITKEALENARQLLQII